MTRNPTPPLIINDGSLGGLVAAWSEGTTRSAEVRTAAETAKAGPIAWMPRDNKPARSRRRSMVERQVTICGLASCDDREAVRIIEPTTHEAILAPEPFFAGMEITAFLLSAVAAAARQGLSRVIWPIHAGPDTDIDLDCLADICDRALLISQLTTIDLPRVAGGPTGAKTNEAATSAAIRIETPYADFTDAELMELAIDLDAPLAACWWCINEESENPCGACTECNRWREALAAVDPQGLLDPASLWGAAQPA